MRLTVLDCYFISHYVQIKRIWDGKNYAVFSLYIPLRSNKTGLHIACENYNFILYIPLRSNKTFYSPICVAADYSFISHYVQIKHRTKHDTCIHGTSLYIPLRSNKTDVEINSGGGSVFAFISHYVQIKLLKHLHQTDLLRVLYIPLRSNKTVITAAAFFFLYSFISHYVQIKP